MPNSCNSIIKHLCIAALVCSCASNLNYQTGTSLNGKFLASNGSEIIPFNLSLHSNSDLDIIQIKKPFYGNVLRAEIDRRSAKIFNLNTSYDLKEMKIDDFEGLASQAILILYQCIKSLTANQKFENDLMIAECQTSKKNALVKITFQNWEISGRLLL